MEIKTRAVLHQELYDAILCCDSPNSMVQLWQLYRDAVNNEYITNSINLDDCLEEIRTIFKILITSKHNNDGDFINLLNKFDRSSHDWSDNHPEEQKYYDNKKNNFQKVKETLEFILDEASSLKVFLQLISKQKRTKADELKIKNKTLKPIMDETNALRDLSEKQKSHRESMEKLIHKEITANSISGNQSEPEPTATDNSHDFGHYLSEDNRKLPPLLFEEGKNPQAHKYPLTKKSKSKKKCKAASIKRPETIMKYKEYLDTFNKYRKKFNNDKKAEDFTCKKYYISSKTLDRARGL